MGASAVYCLPSSQHIKIWKCQPTMQAVLIAACWVLHGSVIAFKSTVHISYMPLSSIYLYIYINIHLYIIVSSTFINWTISICNQRIHLHALRASMVLLTGFAHSYHKAYAETAEEPSIFECIAGAFVGGKADEQFPSEVRAKQVLHQNEAPIGFTNNGCIVELNVNWDPNCIEENDSHGGRSEKWVPCNSRQEPITPHDFAWHFEFFSGSFSNRLFSELGIEMRKPWIVKMQQETGIYKCANWCNCNCKQISEQEWMPSLACSILHSLGTVWGCKIAIETQIGNEIAI